MRGLAGQDLESLDIPNEDAFVKAYCTASGRDISAVRPRLTFFIGFSFFRMAAIAQGVYKRALSGNASASDALQVGKYASVLADIGLGVVTNRFTNSRL